MTVPHRKSLVYGKVKRSASRYDLFGRDDWSDGGGPQHSLDASSNSQTRLGRPRKWYDQNRIATSVEAPLERTSENVRPHVIRKQNSTPSTGGVPRPEPRTKTGVKSLASAFDFSPPSSDDEAKLDQMSAQKRRKLTPVKKDSKNGMDGNGKKHNTINLEEPKPSRRRTDARVQPRCSVAAKPSGHGQKSSIDLPQATKRVHQRSATPKSSLAEDGLQHDAPLYTSPKQTKPLSTLLDSTSASNSNSPSRLPLTSLSLKHMGTPDSQRVGSGSEGIDQVNRVGAGVSRSRRRLIDVMASPRKPLCSSTSSDLTLDDSCSDSVSVRGVSVDTEDKEAKDQSDVGARKDRPAEGKGRADIGPSQSSSSLGMGSQARITYSKERSHLADMLADELFDPISQTSSQIDGLLRHDDKLSGSFDQAISEDDTDGDAEQGVASIRSIHELRRAGGRARSQVDMESIFEDIEAKGAMAHARRLRGLAVLTERLTDAEVGQHILEHGLDQRLRRCPLLDGDLVGQTLLTICLTRLTCGTQLPNESLEEILSSLVPAGGSLLREPGDFEATIRDGAQRLSKGTCMKIIGMTESFRSSPVWATRRPERLSPQLVFIRFLDVVIRQVRQLGDFGMTLSTPIFRQLVHILLQTGERESSQVEDRDCMVRIELVISVLESLTISGNWVQDGGVEVAKDLCRLGPLLTELAQSCEGGSRQTYHLILRLILNVMNNNARLCDDFAEPELISSFFGIVQRDFLDTGVLKKAALKQARLEGVILALGALSNLAEHSERCRQIMFQRSVDARSMVDWITVVFRDQAEIASEVWLISLLLFITLLW
jgi:hypothetical protein